MHIPYSILCTFSAVWSSSYFLLLEGRKLCTWRIDNIPRENKRHNLDKSRMPWVPPDSTVRKWSHRSMKYLKNQDCIVQPKEKLATLSNQLSNLSTQNSQKQRKTHDKLLKLTRLWGATEWTNLNQHCTCHGTRLQTMRVLFVANKWTQCDICASVSGAAGQKLAATASSTKRLLLLLCMISSPLSVSMQNQKAPCKLGHIGTKYFELAPVPESIKGFRSHFRSRAAQKLCKLGGPRGDWQRI